MTPPTTDTTLDDAALTEMTKWANTQVASYRGNRVLALIAELRRLRADLDVERVKRASDLLEASARDAEVEALRDLSLRLAGELELSERRELPVARAAIDAARRREEG